MLCTLQSTLTGEYSKAKRAEDTPQMIWIDLDPDEKWGPALLLEALWDWRDNMCDDDARYDSDVTQEFNAPCARHASLCPRGLGLGVCSSFAPAALALVSSANWKFNWAPFFIK